MTSPPYKYVKYYEDCQGIYVRCDHSSHMIGLMTYGVEWDYKHSGPITELLEWLKEHEHDERSEVDIPD